MKRKWKLIVIIIVVLFAGGYFIITNLPEGQKSSQNDTRQKEKKIMYKSSMNPNEVSDKPGKDSMGMDMIPFEADKKEDEIKTPSGLAPVTITKEKQELIGLSFEEIKIRNIHREIRTSTRIVPDETRQFKVTTKVNGWVEELYVNQTGQFVKKGSPLLSVYSPELLSAQQEYLSVLNAKQKLKTGSDSDMSGSLDEIEKAALDRLRLLDLSDEQIDRIGAAGSVERAVTLYAPSSGYVTEKMVLKGQKIMMNDALMVIIDLSSVWGEIDLHETDLPYVRIGMPVEVTLSYWQGKIFKGTVSFLNPFMDADTRVLKARIVIPNTGSILKPNMYGDAKLSYNTGKKTAVPEEAVMQTGERNYVFVKGKGDLIVPYEVKLGTRSIDGYYEVVSGLKAGERVVTSANYLVDSESSLKAAFKKAAD